MSRPTPHHGAITTIAIALIAGSAVLGLLVAGITFGALAIAFPLAVPIAEQAHVQVSTADALLAERFASLWLVFGAFAIASLAGALGVVVATVRHFERRQR